MNLRQKAKHFKKLYEQGLPKKPYPVIYQTHNIKHYKAQFPMKNNDAIYMQNNPSLLKTHIENRMLQELRPLVWDNLKAETDLYSNKVIYTLDVWM